MGRTSLCSSPCRSPPAERCQTDGTLLPPEAVDGDSSPAAPRVEAMFPLGTVLFPSGLLPLQVFEPRYRAMFADLLAGERRFGVVLIERGSEVGGGEVRSGIGTLARIVEARPAVDGRWSVAAVGLRRIRVHRWLPDDPYPRAEVEDLPDTSPAGPADTEAYPELVGRLRRVLARLSELGEPVAPSTFEAAEEPALGSYQLAALGPFGSYDRQRVLEATSVASRRALLDRLLAEVSEDVDRRLAGEGPGQRR